MIYFIQDEMVCLIKIGVAEDPVRRLAELQTGSPCLLVLLATMPGDESDEKELHERFGEYRQHGEWFRPGPKLLAFLLSCPDVGGVIRNNRTAVDRAIAEADRLCRTTPSGPWSHHLNTIEDQNGEPFVQAFHRAWSDLDKEDVWEDSREFLACSRELLPLLLAEVKRLRAADERRVA